MRVDRLSADLAHATPFAKIRVNSLGRHGLLCIGGLGRRAVQPRPARSLACGHHASQKSSRGSTGVAQATAPAAEPARTLLKFLSGPETAPVLRQHGMEPG